MSLRDVVEKYLQLIKTEHFAEYSKDFADKIQKGLNEGYNQGFYEPALVSVVETIINNLGRMSKSFNGFKISTKSIFIHGNRSQVKFKYYGQEVQRELGDLIFILSVIYNGRKYFEKYTISQFKKDDNRLRWNLSNKAQVYLLSRFPSFRGVESSIIPTREFNLPNYSGCLGSFNLLFRPGDFVFVSASQLESFIGNRKSISINNIYKLWKPPSYYFYYSSFPFPLFSPYFIGIDILGFSHYASNIHDFVDKYLRGFIGELTYSDIGVYNKPALDFLLELLSAIRRKAQEKEQTEVVNFVDDFFRYPYGGNEGGVKENVEFDYEGGGIGIIYTSINLGEGEG